MNLIKSNDLSIKCFYCDNILNCYEESWNKSGPYYALNCSNTKNHNVIRPHNYFMFASAKTKTIDDYTLSIDWMGRSFSITSSCEMEPYLSIDEWFPDRMTGMESGIVRIITLDQFVPFTYDIKVYQDLINRFLNLKAFL